MTADYYPEFLKALCVWREARSEPEAARRGVLWTIMNRASRKYFGDDAVSVITWPWQFSSFNHNDPNATQMPTPKKGADWRAWLECCALVDDPGEDPTGGAVLYESIMDPDKRPKWADPQNQTFASGAIRFYRT